MSAIANTTPARAVTELKTALAQLDDIILGKQRQLRLALACLLARGHLLIEDMPGMGKTTLAHGLAAVLGLDFRRIQFTSDLLPADVVGVSTYDTESKTFRFHPGPLFASVVLADEINRATPKTQSALLEAMEERQITVDGVTHPLPAPFFVIATQNPRHQIGTFPLPESQLDRFLMRIDLGYPDRDAERALLAGRDRREVLEQLAPVVDVSALTEGQQLAGRVRATDALLDYIQDLIDATRRSRNFTTGLSPRAGLGLLHAAQAWALLSGRDLVLPEDVQTVLPSVVCHRLQPSDEHSGQSVLALVEELVRKVPVP
jgi:MoxR-like ATPase